MGSLQTSTLMPATMQIPTCHKNYAYSWWSRGGCSAIVKFLPGHNYLQDALAINLHIADRKTRQKKSENAQGKCK